jgi:hypothetical protein
MNRTRLQRDQVTSIVNAYRAAREAQQALIRKDVKAAGAALAAALRSLGEYPFPTSI